MALNTLNNNYRNEIENSFAANFWGKGDRGLEVLLNHMRRTKEACDNLNKVLKGRAEIEENYGRQLVELSKNLIDQDEIISMRDSMETLRLEIEATGQSRIDLALDVKEQINNLLNEFSSNQEKIINNYKTVMERHLYLKNSHTQEVIKVNEKYQKKCEAALAISNKLNSSSNDEEINYYKNLLRQSLIEAKEIDKEYIMVVNRLHQIYRKWQQEWTRKCENFQKFEEDRIRFLFDQMWNYANMFSTVCVADDEGCEKLRVQLEKCDSKKDVIYYIKEHKTGSVISEAPKYINYYSNIQYLEDIVDLNGDGEKHQFTIPHSVRNESRGRMPQIPPQGQGHQQPIRQSSFPSQYNSSNNNNGGIQMNSQLQNQNYVNGSMHPNQSQQTQKLQSQNPPNNHMISVNQHQLNNNVEMDEEKKNKMKKSSIASLKKKFGKARTSLYVTNKSPNHSDDESDKDEKRKKSPNDTSTPANNNNKDNDTNSSNNNNSNNENNNKENMNITVEKGEKINKNNKENLEDPNASIVSVVPQIPAVEEEEKRMSHILNQSLIDDINSDSYMKTPIPNAGQQPSHALPPAPVMMDTSIIIPPSAIMKNESEMDEDKTSLTDNIESLGDKDEKIVIGNEEKDDNKKSPQTDEINSNTENTMIPDNEIVEGFEEIKEDRVEEQRISEIVESQQNNDDVLVAEVKDVEEIENIEENEEMAEEMSGDQPLIAEVKDVEDIEQKYNEGNNELKSSDQDIDDTMKSSLYNDLDIKPIPTFKELGFRDSYGNYSTTSTDDVESVNIIEESSIEIADTASYNRDSYNRESFNSQSYENNLIIIDDNDAASTTTPMSAQINMGVLLDTNNMEFDGNIPKLEVNDGDEADEEIEDEYLVHSSSSPSQVNNNNNSIKNIDNNLQPEIEQEVSTMTIDETLVPIRNASNDIYKEVNTRRDELKSSYGNINNYDEMQYQKRKTYKKDGQQVARMERRESLYGMMKDSYDQKQYQVQQSQQQSSNKTPPNPKRVSSIKNNTMKNSTETNVAEAAIAAVKNKMMNGTQLQQQQQQKPPLNGGYSMQTITTSAEAVSSNISHINNYMGNGETQYQSQQQQQQDIPSNRNDIKTDSPTLIYGLHFIPPMLRNQMVQNQEITLNSNKSSGIAYGVDNQNPSYVHTHSNTQSPSLSQSYNQNQTSYDINNHTANVNNQIQMQNNINKYASSVSSNNSNSSAKISKISAINSNGMANNYNSNRRPSQASLGSNKSSNRTPKFGENSIGSPASVYSNPRNQFYQYMNGAGSSANNGSINGSISGSPHSIGNEQSNMNQQQAQLQQQPQQSQYSKPEQNQQVSQQMKQKLQVQLMPEYQGQPTTPSQEYIEINNIPKSPAIELNSTYNPYDLRIKKPVLFSVKTLYDYEAVSFEEVSFKANFVLPILAVQEDGWWETEVNEMKSNGTICRRRGLIPSNFVEVINE